MKTGILSGSKIMLQVTIFVSAMLFTKTLLAQTDSQCLIYTTELCSSHSGSVAVTQDNVVTSYKNIWFLDSDLVANENATQCMKRINDYYNYCVDSQKKITVYAIFRAHGINVIYKSKNVNGTREIESNYFLTTSK